MSRSKITLEDIRRTDFTDPDNTINKPKAIRFKCLDCMNGYEGRVRACDITNCPLWPWRMGRPLKSYEWAILEDEE
jgi:hypothetical protein